MKTTTEKLLIVMNIFAWIAFVGLMVETGAFLTSYVVSAINAESLKVMYKGSNLYNLLNYNFWQYTCMVSFIVVKSGLQAYTAYLVIKVLSKIRLANPFTHEVSRILERISYFILMIWAIGLISAEHTEWLSKTIAGTN